MSCRFFCAHLLVDTRGYLRHDAGVMNGAESTEKAGPIIRLPEKVDPKTLALLEKLRKKYQDCVVQFQNLRRQAVYKPPEHPAFAPLKYRIALLGNLLTHAEVK